MKPDAKKLLYWLLINSVLFVTLYFVLVSKFPPIMIIYLAAGTVLAFAYVIYNRGFVGKNATPEMLPNTMTPEEKQQFITDCKERLRRSKWMLTVLVPILLTFMLEMMVQFLFPMLEGLFS